MRLRRPLAPLLVLAAACVRPQSDDAGPVPIPCVLPSYGTLIVADRDLGLAPGESRVLQAPAVVRGPYGEQPADSTCPVRWGVEGRGATIGAAGRLSIAPDARPGDSLFVVVNAMGATARRMVKVVDPAPNPLAGTWSQDPDDGCVGPQGPVRELVLQRTGDLLLTFRPFESYVDIAGTYTWNRETGRLVLRSNTRAGVLAEGKVRVEGNRFALEMTAAENPAAVFGAGTMPGSTGCRAVFGRR